MTKNVKRFLIGVYIGLCIAGLHLTHLPNLVD